MTIHFDLNVIAWIIQLLVDAGMILVIIGYKTVFNDILKNLDTLNKNLTAVKALEDGLKNLQKSILGRG